MRFSTKIVPFILIEKKTWPSTQIILISDVPVYKNNCLKILCRFLWNFPGRMIGGYSTKCPCFILIWPKIWLLLSSPELILICWYYYCFNQIISNGIITLFEFQGTDICFCVQNNLYFFFLLETTKTKLCTIDVCQVLHCNSVSYIGASGFHWYCVERETSMKQNIYTSIPTPHFLGVKKKKTLN